MAIDRIYSASFENVSFAAALSAWNIKAGANTGLELYGFSITSSVTTPTVARLVLRRGTATITAGTGGTAITLANIGTLSSVDQSTSTVASVRYGDTAAMSSSGTLYPLMAWQWEMMGELLYLPPPEARPAILANEGVELQCAAALTATISGWIQWREMR
jgi:anthranilate phosphoribosyltransferase